MLEFSNQPSKSQAQSSRVATVAAPTTSSTIVQNSNPSTAMVGSIMPLEPQGNSTMARADDLQTQWFNHLQTDLPNAAVHGPVVQWLLGEDRDRFSALTAEQVMIAQQAMDYRYRILKERYLGMSQERAYRNLMQRLGGVFVLRSKIKTWISLSRDRQRSVAEVLQEIIQEMLQNDSYMQQQIAWIAQCTSDVRLRNALVLTSLEEYCLRPIRNQPLLACRFINYLRRSQRGGMTNVPTSEFVRFVSEEIAPDDNEGAVSLLDNQAIADYQEEQSRAEQMELRQAVVRRLSLSLEEKGDALAAQWLTLYLQGKSQEAIAQDMDIPIKQVYRLREKVSYHALKVFASKKQTALVAEWLGQGSSVG